MRPDESLSNSASSNSLVTKLATTDIVDFLASVEFFGHLDESQVRRVAQHADFIDFERGEIVLREGERSDEVFILVRGSLEVFREQGNGTIKMIDVLGDGSLIGEMAVLLNEPRSVSVRTRRASRLIRIDGQCIGELFQQNANLTLHCARKLAERLKRRTNATDCEIPIKTIVIVPLCGMKIYESFCRELKACFESTDDKVCFVSVARMWQDAKASQVDEKVAQERVSAWFAEQERLHSCVVCYCDNHSDASNQTSLLQADVALYVVELGYETSTASSSLKLPTSIRRELVLLRKGSQPPSGTAAWLDSGNFDTHHHVHLANQANYQRLIRRTRGAAWGLVLSGGGARGLAHLGVIRAVIESGLPIDMIGGTSMGGIVAALYASGRSLDQIRNDLHRAYVSGPRSWDLTIPFVSLHTGRSTNRVLQHLFADQQIEDFPIKFFCVSCNLTRAANVVHDRGLAWKWVRSSCSIPGLVPPLQHQGDLLIDGGFLNNLPVDEMRTRINGRVIASDVSTAVDLGGYEHLPVSDAWSGITQLVRKFTGRPRLPSIIRILMRTAEIGSVRDSRISGNPADIYVHVPLESISMTDFAQADQIIELGYAAAQKILKLRNPPA